MKHQMILAHVEAQTRRQARDRAIRLTADVLMRRLQIDPDADGLVLLLGGDTRPVSNREAVQRWVRKYLHSVRRPDIDSLAQKLWTTLEAQTGDWS